MNCPHCGHDNPINQKFCGNCGKPLPSTPTPLPGGEGRGGRAGERKLVTVLFADVVGSTAMAEQIDPEEVTEIMNGAFAFMNAAVSKYGGTVARLMGDAILAFFGAPAAHEDDAERAVRAGLDMQASAKEYARAIRQKHRLDFQVRVGINTGLAVLDFVGDQIKTEYTAMGDATNVAARMQSAAEPGTVLISADTHRLVKAVFDFTPRGAIEVKGKSAPIEAFQVLAAKETPGTARGLDGLGSPLVGRDAEFHSLRAKVATLRAGQGAFVAVVGEAGLGKSRLMAEARKFSDSKFQSANVQWLEGRSVSYGQSVSYYPWRQIIRQSIGAREGEASAAVRKKLNFTCECCTLPGGDQPFLEALLAVESDESLKTVRGYEGDALIRRMTEATRGYVCGIAQEAPTVLVFDDVHWADSASLDLLLNICDVVERYPLLVVCLLRPDKDAASWPFVEGVRAKLAARYNEIALEPLPEDKARELLGNLLHVEDLPEGVRDLILEKSEGNPFFVEEVIRSLIDSGHIVRQNSHWRATGEIANVAIPNTLAGVLSARVDRLPDEAKRVAQMASVIGRIFAYRVLKIICETAPAGERIEALDPPLSTLARAEIVRERTREPELEHVFKHALTQEAAYNSLLIKRRKEFHRRVGAVLENLHAERLDEFAPALAHHFWIADETTRAADYSMRAGASAMKVYALREAMGHYGRAIEAWDKTPDAPPKGLCDAILGWAEASFGFRPYPEQLDRLARAEKIARELNDKPRLARALYWTGRVHMTSGHATRAIPILAECFALADELGDERLAVIPTFF
ncbi:MAG: AAA family ATPase, partial [Chloroflexi bacterium]|nr:AAA family ATPase [Chloroflexota bacterium]